MPDWLTSGGDGSPNGRDVLVDALAPVVVDLESGACTGLASPQGRATHESLAWSFDGTRLWQVVDEAPPGRDTVLRVHVRCLDAPVRATRIEPPFWLTSLEALPGGTELLAGGLDRVARLDASSLEVVREAEGWAGIGLRRVASDVAVEASLDGWRLRDLSSLGVIEEGPAGLPLRACSAAPVRRRFAVSCRGEIVAHQVGAAGSAARTGRGL